MNAWQSIKKAFIIKCNIHFPTKGRHWTVYESVWGDMDWLMLF